MTEGTRKSPTRRILFADDSQYVRNAVSSWFAGIPDFEPVLLANDGAEAVEQAMHKNPDIAILDLSMPVMDGLEAARRLKRMKPQLPIIIFSLHAESMTMKKEVLEAWGIAAVVRKDRAATELIEKIRELLHLDN